MPLSREARPKISLTSSIYFKKPGIHSQIFSFLVRRKYDLDDKYIYHLKTAMVYFDDAEQELGAIMVVDESRGIRSMSGKEWKEIKDFFVRLCL